MSESTRIKNELLEQARIQGRLSSQKKTEPGASLGNAPDVNAAYQQAQQATQPLEKPTPGPQRAPITAAQQYDPIQSLSVRDQQKAAAQPVQQAKQGLVEKAVAQHRQEQGLGVPEMIQKQQPKPQLNMDTPIGRGVDAQSFDRQWAAEQAKAAAYQEKMAQIAQEARDAQSQDKQMGHGKGMGR